MTRITRGTPMNQASRSKANAQPQIGFALSDDLDLAVAAYNAVADRCRWPRVQVMRPERRVPLQARLRDCGGLEGWRSAMDRAGQSDFLRGQAWMSFDWLIQSANFVKLMEGNYDNRPDAAGSARAYALRDRLDVAGRMRRPSHDNCF